MFHPELCNFFRSVVSVGFLIEIIKEDGADQIEFAVELNNAKRNYGIYRNATAGRAVLYDYRSDGFRAVSRYYFSQWNYINDFLVEIASCSFGEIRRKIWPRCFHRYERVRAHTRQPPIRRVINFKLIIPCNVVTL